MKKDILEKMIKNGDVESFFKLSESKNLSYSNMHLYNSRGAISKYDTPEQILQEFYIIRMAYYIRRKEYVLQELKKDLDICEAKVRFIEEFISGEIQLIRKEDNEIITQLEERNYPRFEMKKNKKKEDDEEDNENNENDEKEEEKSMDGYQYLLHMRINTLTRKKIDELRRQHEKKEMEYNELKEKTEKQLWKNDLMKVKNEIQKLYDEYYEILEENKREIEKMNITKKKKVVLKRQVRGGAGSGGDI
jgi:DNA topoisomerase-2